MLASFLNAANAVFVEGNLPDLAAAAPNFAIAIICSLVNIKCDVPVVGTAGVIGRPADENLV